MIRQDTTLFSIESLTTLETDRLTALEQTIERGLQTFVDVGTALLEIRDSRLYRQTFGTFEDYCRERWGMSRVHAFRMIEAASVANNLLPIGNILPATESQARPLTGLPVDLQREAWQRAVDTAPNGKITAAHVASVVEVMTTSTSHSNGNGHHVEEPDEDFDATEEEIEQAVELIKGTGLQFDVVDDRISVSPSKTRIIGSPFKVSPAPMAVHFSSETPEHYTPQQIVDGVIDVFGSIDLDPCSNSKDAPNIPALQHYTVQDDGLSLRWVGKVYMNPPYGRGIIDWANKLVDEYMAGSVTEAIALVPARTDTQWWAVLNRCRPFVCFVTGRLTFVNNEDAAPFPSAVFYFGPNFDIFYNTFCSLGDIWQKLDIDSFGQ